MSVSAYSPCSQFVTIIANAHRCDFSQQQVPHSTCPDSATADVFCCWQIPSPQFPHTVEPWKAACPYLENHCLFSRGRPLLDLGHQALSLNIHHIKVFLHWQAAPRLLTGMCIIFASTQMFIYISSGMFRTEAGRSICNGPNIATKFLSR